MVSDASSNHCFHCGDLIPPNCNITVTIDDTERAVCCQGCRAVALLITGAQMDAFYQQRTDFAPQPETIDPRIIEWFADENWVANFTLESEGQKQLPLSVSGMSCAACTWLIDKFLLQLPEVTAVDINLNLSRVVISLDPDSDLRPAVKTLLDLGYSVRPWRTDERLEQVRSERKRDVRRLGIAGLGMMQVGMFAIALHAGDLQGIDDDIRQLLRLFSVPLTLFVLFYSGRTFFTTAWRHAKRGALVMDTSVSIALLLATGASVWATLTGGGDTYYDSVTMFVFFLLLARFLEKRLRDADLFELVRVEDSLPEFVNRWANEAWQRLPRDQVEVGDRLRVATGEQIAFDGTVSRGQSAVEESIFNGESVPRTVTEGDPLYAGTVNRDGSLEMIVTSHYRDSRLAALASDVERAKSEKPPYLKLIDRLAGHFVALVLVASTLTFAVWANTDPSQALWSALAVLVVACPCALSLATPAAMASATAALRRRGIKVRGEFGLLAAADSDTVLLDKTGTLTETELMLDTIVCHANLTQEAVLAIAAAMQQFSNHPAARAFHPLATDPSVVDVEIVAGAGLTARRQGDNDTLSNGLLRLGSAKFCQAQCPTLPPHPTGDHYWVALIADNRWLAWLGLAERLHPGAKSCVATLKAMGLSVSIASGDTPERVAVVAKQLGIEGAGSLQPQDKLQQLQDLQQQQRKVIAVGDGLNDAPLLSAANASVAVSCATALAKAQADFTLVEDDLARLPEIIAMARAARRTVRQNLYWAGSYNVIGIPFAALGYVPPWVAALGMSMSSLVVVLNALRLRRMSHGVNPL